VGKFVSFSAAAAIAAGLLGAAPAVAGVMIQPKAVSIVVGGTAVGFDALNMINQSGLATKYKDGVTDFDTYVALKPLHAFDTGEWQSTGPRTSAKVTFDLGAVMEFSGFAFWNEDATSLQAMIMSAPVGGGYAGTGNLFESRVVGQAYGPTVQRHQFIKSRYVSFELFGCNAAGAAASGCGLGEVAFNSATPAPAGVPEPATWAMMILGFLGTGTAIRRRRQAEVAVA
jgi:hypothetical protein